MRTLKNEWLKSFVDGILDYFSADDVIKRYSPEEQSSVAELILNSNIKRILPLSIALTAFQVVFIVLDSLSGFYYSDTPIKWLNISAEAYMLILNIVFFVVSLMYKRYNGAPKITRATVYFYYGAITIGLLLYVTSDVLFGLTSTTAFYLTLIFALFPIFTNREAIIYFLGYFSYSALLCAAHSQRTVGEDMQMLLVLVVSLILGRYLSVSVYKVEFTELRLRRLNEKFEQLSQIDPLTQISNRRGLDNFTTHWSGEVKNPNAGVAAVMVDIDHFKLYNDTFSHTKGDECLVIVSDTINAYLKSIDVESFLARIGGEEFLLVFIDVKSKDDVLKHCIEIRREIQQLSIQSGKNAAYKMVTLSMGVSFSTASSLQDVSDFKELYRCADEQLYNAKEGGRNCLSYENRILR